MLPPDLSISCVLIGPAYPRWHPHIHTPCSFCFSSHWFYIIKCYQTYLWHGLFWHTGIKKSSLSCGNETTCSPRGQINLLVIAHLNISDNSFNINSEFYSFPRFHIYAFISIPLFKSYKGFRTCKDCLLWRKYILLSSCF